MRYFKLSFKPAEDVARRMRKAGLSRDQVIEAYLGLDSFPVSQRAFGEVFGIRKA